MQCADCQRRGNGASSANVILPSSSQLCAVAQAPASTTPTPTPNSALSNQSVSPGSPTPPASPHTPANVTTAPASVKSHQHHHLPPTPPQSSRHSGNDSWSQQRQQLRLLGLGQASPIPPTPTTLLMGLAVTTNNIDLSLPLTSTLLKRATLAGVSHQQLLGLDRAVSFPTLNPLTTLSAYFLLLAHRYHLRIIMSKRNLCFTSGCETLPPIFL